MVELLYVSPAFAFRCPMCGQTRQVIMDYSKTKSNGLTVTFFRGGVALRGHVSMTCSPCATQFNGQIGGQADDFSWRSADGEPDV